MRKGEKHEKKIIQTAFALAATLIVTVAAATGVSAYTYGQWEEYSFRGMKTVTYAKISRGSTQTLNNKLVGLNSSYYFSVRAQLGTDSSYTSVYGRTRVMKDASKSISLSNTVDAGKSLQLILETSNDDQDSVCYQYLY